MKKIKKKSLEAHKTLKRSVNYMKSSKKRVQKKTPELYKKANLPLKFFIEIVDSEREKKNQH